MNRETSPLYVFKTTDLDGRYALDLEEQPYAKYVPYNYLVVKNITDVDINLYVNGDNAGVINKGSIEIFDSEIFPAIRSVFVEATGSSGDIEILLKRTKTMNEVLNTIASKI